MVCKANPEAVVTEVSEKPKKKFRPTPLDTVELEKLGARKLKLTAKETMTIAEKLYSNGIISYPRTETNIFSKDINLVNLVSLHTSHSEWGEFAEKVLDWGPNPRQGKKSDQAHPPIHPTKMVTHLTGNEKKVYDLIVRHFLACVSKDAVGSETICHINIADEEFTANGISIYEKNYLEVYPYEYWNAKLIHSYKKGNIFDPTEISMPEGTTSPPSLLTEADLISIMEKHGIGTDATHAEHINTIKERGYIGEVDGYLVPGKLGMGLVEGYEAMNLELAKPIDRASLESDLKSICEGRKAPEHVLKHHIEKYKKSYTILTEKILIMDRTLGARLNETPAQISPHVDQINHSEFSKVFKCPKCKKYDMILKIRKNNAGFFIACEGFPDCKNAIWLPNDLIKSVLGTNSVCTNCGSGYYKLKFTFKQSSILSMLGCNEMEYTSCIVCDQRLKDILNININNSSTQIVNRHNNDFRSTSTINTFTAPSANTSRAGNNNYSQNITSSTGNNFNQINNSRNNQSDDEILCPKCGTAATKYFLF